jgi:hypothetical protein
VVQELVEQSVVVREGVGARRPYSEELLCSQSVSVDFARQSSSGSGRLSGRKLREDVANGEQRDHDFISMGKI